MIKIYFLLLALIIATTGCDHIEKKRARQKEKLEFLRKKRAEKKKKEEELKCVFDKVINSVDTLEHQLFQPTVNYKTYVYTDEHGTKLTKTSNLKLRFRYISSSKKLLVYNVKTNEVFAELKNILLVQYTKETFKCIDYQLSETSESTSYESYINYNGEIVLKANRNYDDRWGQKYNSTFFIKDGAYLTTEEKKSVDEYIGINLGF